MLLSGTRLEGFAKNQQPTNKLFRNNRNGSFSDVTKQAKLNTTGWASGVTIGDYDNDGNEDLFITYWGHNKLYRNNGNGGFEDVTQRAGFPVTGKERWGSGCAFVDYNRDGRLDLFVANYLKFDLATTPEAGKAANCTWKGIAVNCGPKGLPTDTNLLYRNNGNGTFTDVSKESGVDKITGRYAMTAVVTDYDDDGWSDIYVACDSTASIMYRNNRDGTFTDVALESGTAYNEDGNPQAGMGLAVGDYNNDGLIDIFKTHFSDDLPILYRNTGRGFYEDASRPAGFDHTKYVQWGTGLFDFDNDGFTDVFIVTGSVYPEVEAIYKEYPHKTPRMIFRNLNGKHFVDVTAQSGEVFNRRFSSRGAAFGDIDNDGDTDVLIMNMNDAPQLLRNDTRNDTTNKDNRNKDNNWIAFELTGTKSNRSATGSRVSVSVNGVTQTRELTSQSSYYSVNDARIHFGLGANTKVDAVEIRWASGATETLRDTAANRVVKITEGATNKK